MEERNETFSYTYSAKQQEEVRRIRQKYLPPEASKLEQLRALDESAAQPGKIVGIVVGVLGTLILGVGMCCTMVWTAYFIPGVVIGLVGMAVMAAALPLCKLVTKRKREQLAPEILRLSQVLLEP